MTERLSRWLLRRAPKEQRERYGDELVTVLHERLGAFRGRPIWVRAWRSAHEVLGLMMTVWAWRKADLKRRRTMGGDGVRGWIRSVGLVARGLRRSPGHAIASVIVLAVGIGATTAIFSATNAFFFRPLPFESPGELVALYETNPEFGWTDTDAAPANLLDWKERVDAFEDVAAYRGDVPDVTWIRDGRPILLGMSQVTGNFFDVLGVRPQLGRDFEWAETWSDAGRVVVVSHGFWQTYLGGREGAVGERLEFGGQSAEIVGIMPESFAFPSPDVDFWTPYAWNPEARSQVWFRRAHFVRPIARLRSGETVASADLPFQAVVSSLQTEYPETNRVMGAGMTPLRDFLIRDVRSPLLLLQGAVFVLLLLACVNVANLALLRAAERTREVAVRRALGAEQGRIVRGVMLESLVVAGVGGLLGTVLGLGGVRVLESLTPLGIEGATDVAFDLRVWGLSTLAAIGCGVLFGVAPAVRSRSVAPVAALGRGGRGVADRGGRGVRLLVSAEVALALTLVVGAGLMVRTAVELRNVDPGFELEGTMAAQITIPGSRYSSRAEVLQFWDQVTERLEARPEIRAAGTVGWLPLFGTSWSSQFQAEGWPSDRAGLDVVHRRADAGYFEAFEIPLLRGRLFDKGDPSDGPYVVVINETFARTYFPDEDPIGQRIAYDRVATPESTWYEIVGIVGDQHQVAPGTPVRPEVFEYRDQDWERSGWVVARSASVDLDPQIFQSVINELDPLIPIAQHQVMRGVWQESMAQERLVLGLLGAFALVALLLASVGVYGVTAALANRRRREMGIRMALGAERSRLVKMVLREGWRSVGIGMVAGFGLVFFGAQAMAGLLYGVEARDPLTLAVVGLTLALVATLASWLPARRATRVDPVVSLRAEG